MIAVDIGAICKQNIMADTTTKHGQQLVYKGHWTVDGILLVTDITLKMIDIGAWLVAWAQPI